MCRIWKLYEELRVEEIEEFSHGCGDSVGGRMQDVVGRFSRVYIMYERVEKWMKESAAVV